MITALEIAAGLFLTATLLAAAMILAAAQLGRLASRDDEQRQFEIPGGPRDAVRSGRVRGAR